MLTIRRTQVTRATVIFFRNGASAAFRGVDKVGERYVFNIGGNKYRVIAGIAFSVQMLWVKAVLTHAQYDEGDWK